MTQFLIAGFGGQGVLFIGKILAHAGMTEGMEVSWLPSYGPEMRGGTANCGVCLSDAPIGCPLVTEMDVLIAMNAPSYHKFIGAVRPGGRVFLDSALVGLGEGRERQDVTYHEIPATTIAQAEDLTGLANIILLGQVIRHTAAIPVGAIEKALHDCVADKRAHLRAPNVRALRLGMERSNG